MQVFNALSEFPDAARGAVLAIGNFDGVHRGHQALLGEALTRADAGGFGAGVLTFEPHPRRLFQPNAPFFSLTPLAEKKALLAALGLDFSVVLVFDRALAGLEANDFVEEVLVRGLGVRHVVVGYDFFFGKGRAGSPEVLRALGAVHGFGVTVIEPVGDSDDAFSSSRIRELLRNGDIRGASEQLGYWWEVTGEVVAGAGRGHDLGFPTANIELEDGNELAHGIYAVRVRVDGAHYRGAAYLGPRPTFDNGHPVLEVFLFDFKANLYARRITVAFIERIRGDQAFESADALGVQMAADCAAARRILEAVEKDDPMTRFPIGRAHHPAGPSARPVKPAV